MEGHGGVIGGREGMRVGSGQVLGVWVELRGLDVVELRGTILSRDSRFWIYIRGGPLLESGENQDGRC